MIGNRARDTAPERAVRSAAHRLGLRFLVSARPLPGLRRTADLVFRRQRLAVFVDGCFWHSCPIHATNPTLNGEFWRGKLERTRLRDLETGEALAEAGWSVLRIWEHEDAEDAAIRIRSRIDDLRKASACRRTLQQGADHAVSLGDGQQDPYHAGGV
jgi:DNA mismatch endonuclease (patch repair protein)